MDTPFPATLAHHSVEAETDQSNSAIERSSPINVDDEARPTEQTSTATSSPSASNLLNEEDEASRVAKLGASLQDQSSLERNINRQADQLLTEQANERDQKRLDKTNADKNRLTSQISKLQDRLRQPGGVGGSATALKIRAEIANYEVQVRGLDGDIADIEGRIRERLEGLDDVAGGAAGGGVGEDVEADKAGGNNQKMPSESQRDFLIRTGKITPFSKMPARLQSQGSNLQEVLYDEEDFGGEEDEMDIQADDKEEGPSSAGQQLSHRNLLQPGFADDSGKGDTSDTDADEVYDSGRPKKRRKVQPKRVAKATTAVDGEDTSALATPDSIRKASRDDSDTDASDFKPDMTDRQIAALGDSDAESETSDYGEHILDTPATKSERKSKRNGDVKTNVEQEDFTGLDDGNERIYQQRLEGWVRRRSEARRHARRRRASSNHADVSQAEGQTIDDDDIGDTGGNDEEEWHMPHPTKPDFELDGGYRVPGDIHPSLFDYQRTGVKWLWELYSQQVGGIIGDEMGLGKTIQAIAFLAGLHYSKKVTKPIIVVAPATVMKQWVNEFHTWWPPFRVSILHTSGSGMIDLGRESRREEQLASQMFDPTRRKAMSKTEKAAQRIVDRVVKEGHVLVTTYSGLQMYAELLIPVVWEYAVLDEGHKIRNPNTAITIYCKELRTPNRIILSGTPMQNNLVELWSLFDFVFPMRLGTLVSFRQQFEFPIRQGGYANASNLQVQTASRCAETLKDTISPYLLQRYKVDVAADLPKKSEQVLFCKLTKQQREAYESFLNSDEMKSIVNGKRQVLYGIDILRKICNHPDLQDHRILSIKPGYNYGSEVKSGKMVIVKGLLDIWRKTGHKTLLFAQHRIMLDILQKYIQSIEGLNYCRMDGNTPISARQTLVDEFNNDPDLHVFLLTTKVGGLGVNLTGADRVIIYDPDWNPSTDIQARERAWRLGQKREVQIYRLMIAGTIEEKIFHRQIFKQFLTNKILRDPKQRQTFQLKDLHDLFTLGEANETATETSRLFKGTEVQFGADRQTNGAPVQIDGLGMHGELIPSAERTTDPSIQSMPGVSSLRSYAPDQDEDQGSSTEKTGQEHSVPGDEGNRSNNNEQRIMQSLFARSGLHSALEHDQIINGKRKIAADPKIIEKEAKRVANEAAAELKRAGEAARNVPIGTPTWTGEFGSAGRPDASVFSRRGGRGASGRGGPSSTSIMAGLRDRQAGVAAANGSSGRSSRASTPAGGGGGGANEDSSTPRGKDFMILIRNYLQAHGGQVHTQMLIDHFNRYCGTPQRTVEFKEMLKTIAVLEKGGRGRGKWVLKEQYKTS
ncbi:hypothetical protein MMC25_000300 [Agyrium rufum]|nr:hypothetical protein [Agyrium rufum]